MSASLRDRWLRVDWQALLELPPPPAMPLYGGPVWEEDFDELHRPVSDGACALRSRLAAVLGGDPRQYWLGQRATQMRQQLMELSRPDARLLLVQPEAPFYIQRLQGLGMRVDAVPTDLQPGDVDGLLEHWQHQTALVWVQSPSPLTGQAWPMEAVADLCAHLRDFSLVVLDLSLDNPDHHNRWQRVMDQHENLMLLREFDHGWSLPGLQLAALQAAEPWVEALQKLWPEQQPSRAVERAALDLLTHENQRKAGELRRQQMARGKALCQRWAENPQVRQLRLADAPLLFLQVRQPAALQSALQRQAGESWLLSSECVGEAGWFRLPLADEGLCERVDAWLRDHAERIVQG